VVAEVIDVVRPRCSLLPVRPSSVLLQSRIGNRLMITVPY
jgi:hypothetical protein